MMEKKVVGLFTLAVIGMTVSLANQGATVARADTQVPAASACSLPVCDMDAELARLRALPQSKRFEAVQLYRKNYARSTDLATLKNLADFAVKLQALFVELKEEEFMVREAKSLAGDMLMALAKYSPLNAATLAGYYEQLSGEANRYTILTFWEGRIKEFEDKASLLELVDFFGRAEAISRAAQDPEYLGREAKGAENVITARLVQLYPYFEGTYKINVHCNMANGEEAPTYCNSGFIDRLVIMDTMGNSKLQVSLVNTETGTMLYTFTEVQLTAGGTTFVATGSPSGVLSDLHLELNRATGKIAGYVRNSDSSSTLQIEGQLEASPAAVYDNQAASPNKDALTVQQIVGSYKGSYDGRKVTFSLQTFGADQFGGTMSFDELPSYKLRFQLSRYYPKMGVLVLVANTPTGAHVKVAMFFKNTGTSLQVTGMGFTDLSGSTQVLSLESVAKN
jgi:hypothetical protein